MTAGRDAQNRILAEWLFGKSLEGFGIYSADGFRLRDRDFDSQEEAQRYIDSEDDRLQAPHKSTAKGINIQPCVKAHPDFFTSEDASAMLLEKMSEPDLYVESSKGEPKLWACIPDVMQEGPDKNPHYVLSMHASRKTAIALAALALIDQEEQR